MQTIHFVGGEKGGVGKSFFSRLLAQYFIDRKKPFIGFDTDQSHATFSRFYGGFTSPIKTDDDSLDVIIEKVEQHPDCDIIVDLAAQTGNALFQWIGESGFFSIMEELQCKVMFWHLLDDSADCKNLLQVNLDALADQPVQFVVVKNAGRGQNFAPLESSEPYRLALQRHADIYDLAPMKSSIVQKIDFDNYSFWAAANNMSSMSRVERQRVRSWLDGHYVQFDNLVGVQKSSANQSASVDAMEVSE